MNTPWETTWEEDVTGKPVCVLTNGDLWVRTKGRVDADRGVLFERAWIEAMRLELEHTVDPVERKVVEHALNRAIKEEQISQAMRREAREAAERLNG